MVYYMIDGVQEAIAKEKSSAFGHWTSTTGPTWANKNWALKH